MTTPGPGRPGDSPLILAVDQGTSATKAVVVDVAGTVIHRTSVPLDQQHPHPGRAEQDPADIWASVQRAVDGVLTGVDPEQVRAVGLSTQRESIVLWERGSGKPLGPVVGWQDNRGAAICQRLRDAGHGDRVTATTGLPLDAMFSASKAAALLDTHDPGRERSRRGDLCLGTVDSWLLWQLGGGHPAQRHLIETGNAARTMLLDLRTRTWDPWLLDLFAIPVQTLPTVVASTGPYLTCRNLSPLPDHVPVSAVLGDSHAALFAHAGWRPGRVKATYGTGSSVMGLVPPNPDAGQPPAQPPGVVRTIAWDVDGPAFALEGNIRSSGATLMWLARLLGTTPAQIAGHAADTSNGVTLVPAFNGLGAPWWDDQTRATITGITDGTTARHLARAALESITHQVEDVVAAIERGSGTVTTIRADGGPSANETLMQLQADTSGRDVVTTQVKELSALGAAHLAGYAAGLWTAADLDQLPRHDHHTYRPSGSDRDRAAATTLWHAAVHAARTLARIALAQADASRGAAPERSRPPAPAAVTNPPPSLTAARVESGPPVETDGSGSGLVSGLNSQASSRSQPDPTRPRTASSGTSPLVPAKGHLQ